MKKKVSIRLFLFLMKVTGQVPCSFHHYIDEFTNVIQIQCTVPVGF